jgi:hypothetical protein
MPSTDIAYWTAIVTDAGRGFGRAAEALSRAGIRFVSVLPQLTPATSLGATYVSGYAARQGVDAATFADGLGPALTPEMAGKAVTDLATDTGHDQDAYLFTAGLSPLY